MYKLALLQNVPYSISIELLCLYTYSTDNGSNLSNDDFMMEL